MTRSSQRRKRPADQFPLATLTPYGPDNTRATKLVVSVFERPDRAPSATRTWTTVAVDVLKDPAIGEDVVEFLRAMGVTRTIVADRIMGCPHQEGIDYPMGRACPRCPFWADRDRSTHEPLTTSPPSLSVAEILRALSDVADDEREEALASANGHRDALVEPLLAVVDRGVADPLGASDEDVRLFSYAVYLLAKWREPRAYPAVARWLSMPGEQPFDIGGDIVTEDGARILASVCDGDLAPIKALILNRGANGYGRGAGARALALLAAWGEVPRGPIVEHFLWLAREGLEREHGQVWDSFALACVDIEALEVFPELRRAYDAGFLDPMFVEPEELDEVEAARRGDRLSETLEMAPPIVDVAEATRWWDRGTRNPYNDVDDDDALEGVWRDADEFEVPEPYVAGPKIGRNAPCPCGSGKKFKKCCGR